MMNIKKKENYRKQGRKYFDEMLKKYTIPAIQSIVGGREDTGLCTTSKMAYATWATPTENCPSGSTYTEKDDVCAGCNMKKGHCTTHNVKNAYERCLKQYNSDPLEWKKAITSLLLLGFNQLKGNENPRINGFRWNSSGDLQSQNHLNDMMEVCAMTPDIRYWVSTLEHRTVRDYVNTNGMIPENVNIRLSTRKVNHTPNLQLAEELNEKVDGIVSTSNVIDIEKFDEYVKENKFICPAERYKNKQGLRCEGPEFKCTFCYTGNKNVTYIKDTVVNKIQKLYTE